MGTGTFQIQPIDPLTGQSLTPYTFQTNIEATLQNPVVAGGTIENNPFNLTMTSYYDDYGLSFSTALPIETYLAQYWQINYNNQTGEFQGTLIEDNVEISAAYNYLTLPTEIAPDVYTPYPEYMLEGAQISGVVSPTSIQATIAGYTNGWDYFTININDTF